MVLFSCSLPKGLTLSLCTGPHTLCSPLWLAHLRVLHMQALRQSPGLFSLLGCRAKKQHTDKWAMTLLLKIPGCSRWWCVDISQWRNFRGHTYPCGRFWGPSVHSFTLLKFWAAQYRGTSPAVSWEKGPNLNPRSDSVFLGKSFLSGSLSLNGEPQSLCYNVVRVWATWRIKSLLYLLTSYWTLGRLLEPWFPHLYKWVTTHNGNYLIGYEMGAEEGVNIVSGMWYWINGRKSHDGEGGRNNP